MEGLAGWTTNPSPCPPLPFACAPARAYLARSSARSRAASPYARSQTHGTGPRVPRDRARGQVVTQAVIPVRTALGAGAADAVKRAALHAAQLTLLAATYYLAA